MCDGYIICRIGNVLCPIGKFSMQNAAKREATYEDLLKVPKHLVAEILRIAH